MAHDPPDGTGRRRAGSDPGGRPQGPLVDMARYAGHGLTLALATAAFALLGRWVDGRLSTAPLFMIVGAIVGFIGGFYSLIRAVMPEGFSSGQGRSESSDDERDEHDRRTFP